MTLNQLIGEFERVLNADSDHARRAAAYETELLRRYRAGNTLSRADQREARRLIRRDKA